MVGSRDDLVGFVALKLKREQDRLGDTLQNVSRQCINLGVQPRSDFGGGMVGILRVQEAQAAEFHGEEGLSPA